MAATAVVAIVVVSVVAVVMRVAVVGFVVIFCRVPVNGNSTKLV